MADRQYWVISDTHFNHEKSLTFADPFGKRVRSEFRDVNHMNEEMIARWNECVKPNDYVYHLGDVFFGPKVWFEENFPKLHGQKRLIVGNHDDIEYMVSCRTSSGERFFKKILFWKKMPQERIILSHVPLAARSVYDSKRKSYMVNVHGHIHGEMTYGNRINVSVEMTNFTPVNLDTLTQQAKEILE